MKTRSSARVRERLRTASMSRRSQSDDVDCYDDDVDEGDPTLDAVVDVVEIGLIAWPERRQRRWTGKRIPTLSHRLLREFLRGEAPNRKRCKQVRENPLLFSRGHATL